MGAGLLLASEHQVVTVSSFYSAVYNLFDTGAFIRSINKAFYRYRGQANLLYITANMHFLDSDVGRNLLTEEKNLCWCTIPGITI